MAQTFKVPRARCAHCRDTFQIRATKLGDRMCAMHREPDSRTVCPGYYDPPEEIVLVEVKEWMLSLNDKRWLELNGTVI